MFPRQPFAGIWERTVAHLLPAGAAPGQVVVEPDLLHAPEAVLRAIAAGAGVAAVILGVAELLGVAGVEVRALDPPLRLELEAVWRSPARPAVRGLIDFLVRSARDPQAVIDAPERPAGAEVG